MQLKDKKVVFLGDSITEGVGVTAVENRYTEVFKAISECEIFVDGIGGSRIAPQKDADMSIRQNKHFSSRVPDLPDDADYIVVFGGTNDFGHGNVPLGAFDDKTEDTFYGAMHVLCQSLLQKYPCATIIFMTPLHRLTENNPINEIGLPRKLLIDYVDAIKKVCAYYSLPVLDLYSVSGMQPSVEIIRQTYMPDGLHPSNAGAKRIAERLKQFILGL